MGALGRVLDAAGFHLLLELGLLEDFGYDARVEVLTFLAQHLADLLFGHFRGLGRGGFRRLSLEGSTLRFLEDTCGLGFSLVGFHIVKSSLKHFLGQSLLILLLITTLLFLFLVELFDFEKLDMFFSSKLLLILESLPLDTSHFSAHLSSPYG